MKAASSRKTDRNYLLVASTERELLPLRRQSGDSPQISFLCCGVGLTEAAYNLTCYLAENHDNHPSGVINFGIGGAYPEAGVELLDFCLASREIIADLGVCDSGSVNFLTDPSLNMRQEFRLNRQPVYKRALASLVQENIPFQEGVFVTLNCASGTGARGEFFRTRHQGLCENMEGAALARVCSGFAVDFLELRIISNIVEDRGSSGKWLIDEACELGGNYTWRLVKKLLL